jgi:hypothetical protein
MGRFSAFDGVLIAACIGTFTGFFCLVKRTYKFREMNVFGFLICGLVTMALIVRALFFLIDMNTQDFSEKTSPVAQSSKMFAFLWSYPTINYLLASYVLPASWYFDLRLLSDPDMTRQILRKQQNDFVGGVILFVMILYLVYMLNFPMNMGDELTSLFVFIAIFNLMIASMMFCSI